MAKYLNFSLAAKYLHITQPGLSRHILSLENEIGIKLFKRDTHQVKLTEVGEQFLIGIQKIVDDYDFLCETVKKGGIQKITIGVPYYGVHKYLSHIMSPFKADYPEIKIDYLPAYAEKIIEGLLSMQVDVAVLPKVDFFNSEDLIFHDAFIESVVVMMNRDNPLSQKREVKICDLIDEKFIFLKGSFGDALYKSLCSYCRNNGIDPPQKTKKADTIEAEALSILPDTGVMMLPGHLKEANISGNIKWIKILDKDFKLTVSLVHHPENQNPIIHQFINYYLKSYISHP